MRGAQKVQSLISLERGSLNILQLSSPPRFLCITCRIQSCHYSSRRRDIPAPVKKKRDFTDRLREKIWGTTNPPGQVDPYSHEEALERKVKELEELERASRPPEPEMEEVLVVDPPPPRSTQVDYTTREHESGLMMELVALPLPVVNFPSWGPEEAMKENNAIMAALRRALVEVYTSRLADERFADLGAVAEDITQAVQIGSDGQGGVSLGYPENMSAADFLQSMFFAGEEEVTVEEIEKAELDAGEEATQSIDAKDAANVTESPETTADQEELSSEELVTEEIASDSTEHEAAATPSLLNTSDKSWLKTPLGELDLKFDILKRVTQLTGLRIKDSDIRGIMTAGSLLKLLCTPPKATKLVEELVGREQLMTLPNVSVFGRKITRMDKEVQVGRWKVIEEELRRRELPIEYPR